MAACDVVQPSVPSSNNPAFSPLTLFECTIQNASMLVDSMPDRELMLALKIVLNLHSHVVDVLDPRYDNICTRSEQLKELEITGALNKNEDRLSAADPTASLSSTVVKNESNNGFGGDNTSILGSALDRIKQEQDLDDWEDEDCVITDDFFNEADNSYGGYNASPVPKSAKRSRMSASAAGDVSGGQEIPAECKTIMRRAYKALKGSGPHLFDFSLPYSHQVNQDVAERVTAKAQEMARGKGWSDEVWSMISYTLSLSKNRNFTLPRIFIDYSKLIRTRHRLSKLSRRQRSFELVASRLNTDDLEKFRVILQKDYTSSDEECGVGGDEGQLRVRELSWESNELKRLKRQLDDVYSENCATQKQREQLERVLRDPQVRSQRPPPDGAPGWALN